MRRTAIVIDCRTHFQLPIQHAITATNWSCIAKSILGKPHSDRPSPELCACRQQSIAQAQDLSELVDMTLDFPLYGQWLLTNARTWRRPVRCLPSYRRVDS